VLQSVTMLLPLAGGKLRLLVTGVTSLSPLKVLLLSLWYAPFPEDAMEVDEVSLPSTRLPRRWLRRRLR